MTANTLETDLTIGPSSINAYSRLSYTMWHALAEFIDNSTQSRMNYGNIIDQVLKAENTPLVVDIIHSTTAREIRIEDNSIGMTLDKLKEGLKIAHPTRDSRGRSKYGMGMKTAACWIGSRWKVITCEWASGEEWTATVDVEAIGRGEVKVPLTMREVDRNKHYTHVVISNLHRRLRKVTVDTIKIYLGSMYRHDLESGRLKLTYGGEEILPPGDLEMDTDPTGKPMKQEFATTIAGHPVKGWFGVLKSGGRKYGGFSLFQNERQIQGMPAAWKPKSIFGGVNDEGANNLIAQRLTGVIDLDGFEVSHTKDAILFRGEEEDLLEDFLIEATKDYREYAQRRRSGKGCGFNRDKARDMLEDIKKEFSTTEFKDTVASAVLPPIDTILANNKQQVAALKPEDQVVAVDLLPDLKVIVSELERSEYEPYVTVEADASPGVIHVIINGLHPYYASVDTAQAEECFRQFICDAIAEYRVSKLQSRLSAASVRRFKDALLRAGVERFENLAADERDEARPERAGEG